MQNKTVLYFIAGSSPTAAEQVEIDLLSADWLHVLVRRADVPAGLSAGSLEPADAIAGSPPAAYTAAIANYPSGNVTPGPDSKPEALLILPSAATSIAAAAGTIQLRLCKAERNETTGAITLTDITSGAESAWSSATPSKVTVDADSGLCTGAGGGAGSSVITATVTYDTDKTVTATKTITAT